MPGGGGKGPSQSGTITQQTVNPTQAAQLPFLTGEAGQKGIGDPNMGWNQAVNLAHEGLHYYPGQTLADFNPYTSQGFQSLADSAQWNLNNTVNTGNNAFNAATTGAYGVQNSPAYGFYSKSGDAGIGLATGSNPLQQNLANRRDFATNTLAQTALGDPYSDQLRNWAYGQTGLGTNIGNLNGLANASAANPYAGMLRDLGLSGAPGLSDPEAGLWGNASWATNGGGGKNALTAAANGAFLNRNPYIDQQYDAAARPLTRNYMTATAPQTDSNYELAGRYGSGVLGNARSQNEQNLGKSLGDLGANLYGQDYANERGLMTQAGQAVENNFLNAVNASTQANSALGNLRLGEYGARAGMLNQAGNQYLSGLGQGISANTSAGQLTNQDYAQRANVLQSAGNQWAQSQQLGQNAFQQGSNLDVAALNSMLGGITGLTGAANGLQGGYDAGNRLAIQGLALEPSVLSSGYGAANALTQAGQGLTGLSQQQIADQMARFYGEQNAPWETNSKYLSMIGLGNPVLGSSQQTTPVLGPSGLSSALGTIGGLNSAFGSNGALGGLLGGGSAFGNSLGSGVTSSIGGGLGDVGTAAGFFGPTAAEAGGGGLLSGLGAALPFAATVICTELRRQGRMPKRYYVAAARADAKIPQIVRNGYYVWAIPSVHHLRRKPNSLYSRILEKTFNWRAEDLAARAGVKGARKLWRGRAVTAALALPCLALGLLCRNEDMSVLYDREKLRAS